MRHSVASEKKVIVTTSWDDGHPLDRRLADLLSSYEVKGTFYIAPKNPKLQTMQPHDLNALHEQGMEIGSHTLTHAMLPRLSDDAALDELVDSRKALQDSIGTDITSFCYPMGKFNTRVRSLVRQAGYALARTTVAFRQEPIFDPYLMPVSVQVYSHKARVHAQHALREGNIRGLLNWLFMFHAHADIVRLASSIFEYALANGGVLHLWGHSWEIESCDLWSKLEAVLDLVARRDGVRYLTNSQVVSTMFQ